MDTIPLAAPAASTRHALRFEGTVGEYFKIWIVNLALSVVTLGIFSAWAKVRSKRYLYGNTFIDAHAFDYHAQPLRILLGRAIALALLMGYSLTSIFARPFAALWFLLFAVAFPWLVMSSLRFSARNTSYRNVRFDFQGSYGGAFKAFVLWQFSLAAITLFIALPFSHRARDYYTINNHKYGAAFFFSRRIFGRRPLWHLWRGARHGPCRHCGGDGDRCSYRDRHPRLQRQSPHGHNADQHSRLCADVFLTLPPIIGALTFNLALNNTKLGERLHFESRLSPLFAWLGLRSAIWSRSCSPWACFIWARIRVTRYRASCLTAIGSADIGDFAGIGIGSGSAVSGRDR